MAHYLYTGVTDTYRVQSIPYNPLPFNTGTPIRVNADDVWSGVLQLPFNFCFFGTAYNKLIVGSNGCVSFDTINAGVYNSASINGPIPANLHGDLSNTILVPWQDIDPTNRGALYSEIGGVYPFRYCKISWDSIPYYGDRNSVSTGTYPGALWASSQVILYETTNIIEIYIRDKSILAAWNGGLAVEGIVDPTATRVCTVPGRNATQWTASNDAWRFAPGGPGNAVSIHLLRGHTAIYSAYGDTTQTIVMHICPPSSPMSSISTRYFTDVSYATCDGGLTTVTDSMDITVPATVPVGNHIVCLHSSIDLSSCWTGIWAADPGNPSATTINGAIISGLDSVGVYLFTSCIGASCDTVKATVVPMYTESTYATICATQSYSFYGHTYTSTGIYSDTLLSGISCDTIASLYLTVVSPDTTILYDTICAGLTFRIDTMHLSNAGTYTLRLTGSRGCDSVVVLHLSIDTAVANIIVSGDLLIADPQTSLYHIWYYNGIILGGSDTITATQPGTYMLYLVQPPNCAATSAPYIIAGISEITDKRLRVYPNPGNGSFMIESKGLVNKEYTICDVVGQVVSKGRINQPAQPLDMSGADNGIYLLSMEGLVMKLIISR
jgi:hypothetical protein